MLPRWNFKADVEESELGNGGEKNTCAGEGATGIISKICLLLLLAL